jgi:hypothetical protein
MMLSPGSRFEPLTLILERVQDPLAANFSKRPGVRCLDFRDIALRFGSRWLFASCDERYATVIGSCAQGNVPERLIKGASPAVTAG